MRKILTIKQIDDLQRMKQSSDRITVRRGSERLLTRKNLKTTKNP